MQSSEHLTDSEIAGFVDGDVTAAERRRVEEHAEACSSCRAALVDVLRAVDSYAGANPAHGRARADTRRRRLLAGIAGLAAAAVVLLVVGLPSAQSPVEQPVRAPLGGESGQSDIQVASPADNDTVPAVGARLTWSSSGADVYSVTIQDDAGTPLWSVQTSDTSLAVPADAGLTAGRLYFWRVDGVTAGITSTTGARVFHTR